MGARALTVLQLIAPPLRARHFPTLGECSTTFGHSQLYMIVQRPAISLGRPSTVPYSNHVGCAKAYVRIPMMSAGHLVSHVTVAVDCVRYPGRIDFTATADYFTISYEGEKAFVRSAEGLLFEATSRRLAEVGTFGADLELNASNATPVEYRVHYIGIGPRRGSLLRLLSGHDKLLNIVLTEPPMEASQDIRNEILLLLFRVRDFTFVPFEPANQGMRRMVDEYLTNLGPEFQSQIRASAATVVADAEKALVHVLSPEYNAEKYAGYPASRNGMSRVGLDGYALALADPITLHTADRLFRGGRDPELGLGGGDAIVVESRKVTIRPVGAEEYTVEKPFASDGTVMTQIAFREDDRYVVLRVPESSMKPSAQRPDQAEAATYL